MPLRDLVPNLQSSVLFDPMRNAYLRILKPHYWNNYIVGLRNFYAQFITSGSLVFDVGANVGEYTKAFLHLGAKVIAVEPLPGMVEKLNQINNKNLTVAPCAVGENEDILPLHVSDRTDISSLSADWLDVLSQNDGWTERPQWKETINVRVSTLDSLIGRFGVPDFLKIDVEGFELNALRGLSKVPRCLSFEFNAARTESTLACIDRFKDSRFNYIIGAPSGKTKLALPSFVDAARMTELSRTVLADCRTFGDIFVR